jgi:hypothetical protein
VTKLKRKLVTKSFETQKAHKTQVKVCKVRYHTIVILSS